MGDGVDNWAAISEDGPSARKEIIHVVQASGSVLPHHALRSGELKLVWSPAGIVDMGDSSHAGHHHLRAGWYPPPSLRWGYANLTVVCGPPPARTPAALDHECANESAPCLFNITADPCEYTNLASARPDDVARLTARLREYAASAVLSYRNFVRYDNRSDPVRHGPTLPISPDPLPAVGPHVYEGVWVPYMSDQEERKWYPSHYVPDR